MSLSKKDPEYRRKMERLTSLEKQWFDCFIKEGIEDDSEIRKKIPKYQKLLEDSSFVDRTKDLEKILNNTKKLRQKVTDKLLGESKIRGSGADNQLVKYIYVNEPNILNKKLEQRYILKEDFETPPILVGKVPEKFPVYVGKTILDLPTPGYEAFRSTFEIEDSTVYVRENVVSIPRHGFKPRILRTSYALFEGENGGCIGCYSRDKAEGVCHLGGGIYLIGQIWLEGRYVGRRFEPKGHEGIEDLSTISELNYQCDLIFPSQGGTWAGGNTLGWFEGRTKIE